MENFRSADGSVILKISAEEVREMTGDGSEICIVTTAQIKDLGRLSAREALKELEREKSAEDWLTQTEAAKLIKVSAPTFGKIVESGKIKFSQVSPCRRMFKRREVEEYMARREPLFVRYPHNITEECAGQ